MSDIGIELNPIWYPLLAYFFAPGWAALGALLGMVAVRAISKTLLFPLLGALAGSQLMAWGALLLEGSWGERGAGTRAVGLLFCGAVLLGLFAISRARSRRRAGN
jgi:hypothetical protein